jgi:RHS repeat-associated protein
MANSYLGTLKGEFSVSADGAAVYSIDLPLPRGTRKMGPRLSLVYNSSGGNDLLGMGWQIGGLSIVSRVGATAVQDGFHGAVNYTASDRYTLDGGRLVPVTGSYGEAGAVYHTEIETWKQVTPAYGSTAGRNGPDSFTAIDKDGVRHDYGGTSDSQVAASASNPSIRVWAVNRITDRNGNYMTVAYNNVDGTYSPARIDYTGNGSVAPQRSVRFTYEDRPDVFTHYVGGYPVAISQRLHSIDVYVQEQKALTYAFQYEPAPGTGRSRLVSIAQSDGSGNALTPTVFAWQDADANPLSATPTVTPTSSQFGGEFLPCDIGGSGRMGFVNAYPANNELALSLYPPTAGGGFSGPIPVAVTPGLVFGGQLFPVDVDGNGATDLVYVTSVKNQLAFTIFSAVSDGGNWGLQQGTVGGGLSGMLAEGGGLYPADVNGDGAIDFVYAGQHNDAANFTVVLASQGSYTVGNATQTALPFGGVCFPLDANGDGQTDVVYAYLSKGFLQLAVLLSNGTSLTLENAACLPAGLNLPFTVSLIPMDINGDGLTDIVAAGLAADGVSLTLTPLLNTGAGFSAGALQTFTDIPFGALLSPADVLGHGRTDLVASVTSGNNVQLRVLVSNGAGFTEAPLPPALESLAQSPLLPVDLAGLGISGLVFLTQVENVLHVQSIAPGGSYPDLISTITNGVGGQHSLTYLPLTNGSVYTHTAATVKPQGMLAGGAQGATYSPSQGVQTGSPAAMGPARIVTIPKYVVATHVKSDGRGGSYSYSYGYTNAGMDMPGGRGWQGFATQACTDADAQTVTTNSFAQAFPFTGTAIGSTVRRASDNALMTSSVLTPQEIVPYANVYDVVIQRNETGMYTFGQLDGTQVTSTEFDGFGNATLVSNLGDGTGAALYTRHTYNNDTGNWIIGQHLSVTRAADAAISQVLSDEKFAYDPATGNVLTHSVWHDQAGVWLESSYEYDSFGNHLQETDPSGAVRKWTYETTYNTYVETVTQPPASTGAALTTSYAYDPVFGTMLQTTDANGVTTQLQINGVGQITAEMRTGPSNAVVAVRTMATAQDSAGLYQETRTALDWEGKNWTQKKEYLDGLGRTYSTVTLGADGATAVTVGRTHNSRGQIVTETLPYYPADTPAVMQTSYDGYGRHAQSVKPADGGGVSVTNYEYTSSFITVETEGYGSADARQTTTVNGSFNGKALPLSVTDGAGGFHKLAYDALGRMTEVTDAIGTTTTIAYDTLGQKTGVTVQNGGKTLRSESNVYDMVKRSATTTDSRGCTVTQVRDANYRLSLKTDSDGNQTAFVYDTAANYGLGRLASMTMPGGAGYSFDYDPEGNETTIDVGLGGAQYTFQRSFLPYKKPGQSVFPDGAVQTNTFTPGGMVGQVAIAENGQNAASATFSEFTASGKPQSVAHANGISEALAYNSAGQLHSQTVAAAQATLLNTTFGWNAVNDLASITDEVEPANSYGFQYDGAGRLRTATGPYQTPQSFAYDLAGNLQTKAGVAFGYENGLLTSAGGVSLGVDGYGNTSSISSGGKVTELGYDPDGRLNQAGGVTFSYDYSGRRLSKSAPGGALTYYVSPDYEVTILPNGTRQHTKYLRTPLGLAASITTVDQAGSGSQSYPGTPAPGVQCFHRNQINSSTVVTDGNGNVAAKVSYLPFGEIAALTGSDAFRAKFGGRELDSETDLYYFGARYYFAELGRFIMPDDRLGGPIGKSGAANGYAYVLNSPVGNVDPTGHSWWNSVTSWVSNAATTVGNAVSSAAQTVGTAVASAAVATYNYVKTTGKKWIPWVVDGLLVVAGAVVLATTPFGGPLSAMLGGALLSAGINGFVYNATHTGDNFSWEHWGVQLGVGAAVGVFAGGLGAAAGAMADGLAAAGEASFAVGGGARLALMAFTGAVIGSGGNAFSTYVSNIDNGKPAAEGVGWAAVVGGVVGGVGGGASEGLSSSFSRSESDGEVMNRWMDDPDDGPIPKARVFKTEVGWQKALLKAPPTVFSGGGKALLKYGPQWSW